MLNRWSEGAAKAIDRLKDRDYGERMEAIRAVAAEIGQNEQTLRRAIAAWRFLEDLKADHPDLAPRLATKPIAAVEHLARWHRRDPAGAVAAAEALIAGRHTVRSLGQAEMKGRASTWETSSPDVRHARGRGREHDFKARLILALRRGLGDARIVEPVRTQRFNLPIDILIDDRVAVLIAGPYQVAEIYPARAVEWCLRAMAVELLSRKSVALIVPAPRRAGYLFRECAQSLGLGRTVRIASCDANSDPVALWAELGPDLVAR